MKIMFKKLKSFYLKKNIYSDMVFILKLAYLKWLKCLNIKISFLFLDFFF